MSRNWPKARLWTLCTSQHSLDAEYPASTAVVCHDAGAANVVIAELQSTGRSDWRAFMQGPAVKLWAHAFPRNVPFASIERALLGADFLLSGTGWASDVEHRARSVAKARGIRSVALIDHWVGYAARFVREGETLLPDEIWVTDEYAFELAKKEFEGRTIRRIPNRYLASRLDNISRLEPRTAPPELLYILEPARSEWGRASPGEFQALDYFMERLPDIGLAQDVLIRLRPHPSDPIGKYDAWIAGHHAAPKLEIDRTVDIAESIGAATWIAGCESYALVIALAAGKRTYCSLPPWAPPCRLPHDGLIHLKEIGRGA